jgi:hypothetical protein
MVMNFSGCNDAVSLQTEKRLAIFLAEGEKRIFLSFCRTHGGWFVPSEMVRNELRFVRLSCTRIMRTRVQNDVRTQAGYILQLTRLFYAFWAVP